MTQLTVRSPIVLLLFLLNALKAQNLTKVVIGIAAAQQVQPESIGWAICGGAVTMAIERLHQKEIATDFEFETIVQYTECDRNKTVAVGLDFMTNQNVDVIIGPPCVEALKMMGTLSQVYKKPVLGWGFVSDTTLSDRTRFPYMTSMLPTSESLGYATDKLLALFDWNIVAMLYITNPLNYCASVMDDVETVLNDPTTYTPQIVLKYELDPKQNVTYTSTLLLTKSRARVILFCAQTAIEKRDYMIRLSQLGMDTDEYVHIMLSMRSVGFGTQSSSGKSPFTLTGLSPVWETLQMETDGLESLAKSAASKFLVIDINSVVEDVQALLDLHKNSPMAVREPPVNCSTPECLANNTDMGIYARHLYDAIWLYGLALNGSNVNRDNVTEMIERMKINFEGMTGEVTFDQNLVRLPVYQVYGLDDSFDQIALMNLEFLNGSAMPTLTQFPTNAATWTHWNGVRPLATPICGFTGTDCPQTTIQKYGVMFGILTVVILFTFFVFLVCGVVFVRDKRLERARINAEWQIGFNRLTEVEKPSRSSKRSLNSTRTNDTSASEHLEGSNFRILDKDTVMTKKYARALLQKSEMDRFVKMRKLDHENVNKFIGLSIDGIYFIAVWKVCGRGSLEAIIAKGNFTMDAFFILCIIRDIAEGLAYLHRSFLRVHGGLRSGNCLVNDSWQVKISDYGLDILNEEETPSKRRLLWVAPEVMRASILPRNMDPSADVYSFAIIASEIVTKKEAWDLHDRKESSDEIMYQVKKGGSVPMRPDMLTEELAQQNLVRLIKDCWSESPENRPTMEVVCNLLTDQMPKTKTNLMDHVFKMLEEYTSTLEVEVEERTKELTLEKKKADILLCRMLPKQVAERLKQGQTVEPEGFDSVTVMFGDVVKFTQLAAKCSPFQVVNMLNDLFSNFDTIIEEHGVYKVESIGDGYLCVSGLPTRNGYAHIKQIIDMSLKFMSYVKTFKVGHLPKEKVELRIGVNSGPCVAGVVGLSMPRYCLFGDTVNTASRMESNGKASHIHLSSAANSLLNLQYPGEYCSISRGDVIIKGKGVMQTFWVMELGGTFENPDSNNNQGRNQSQIVVNPEQDGIYRDFLKGSK